MEYTSHELREIASEAPLNTIDEDIESEAQKKITLIQIACARKIAKLKEKEFAADFYFTYKDKLPEHQMNDAYEKELEFQTRKYLEERERLKKMIYQARDRKLDNYHS